MPLAEEKAFLQQIRRRPEDDSPRLIFADWLDEHGDPRGEFIRIQCALARVPDGQGELRDRERQLLEANEADWSVPVSKLAGGWQFRRGFVDCISVEARVFARAGGLLLRAAPIVKARFLNVKHTFLELVDSKYLGWLREVDLCGSDLGDDGVALLGRSRHSMRFRMLDLGFNDLTDRSLRALAGMPHLGRLRALRLSDNLHLTPSGLKHLAESQNLQSLNDLDLSGCGLDAEAVEFLSSAAAFPRLTALALHSNPVGDRGIEYLARSELFERMLARSRSLAFPRMNIGPRGVRVLANSALLQGLETLILDSNAIDDEGVIALAESPWLHNLRYLSLRDNRITDIGLWALRRSPTLAGLSRLDLSGNFITGDQVEWGVGSGEWGVKPRALYLRDIPNPRFPLS